MTSNRAAVLLEPGRIVVEDRAVPEIGPHDVLVRVRSVGVCGSDVHYFEHGRIGDFVVRSPLVLGHEASGTVLDVGSEVRRVKLGERVAIEPGWPDGSCEQCLAGRYNLCPQVHFLATPPVDGAFTELLAVPEAFAHPVPDSLSDDAAALIEPLSVAISATRNAGVRPGSSVLITGAGPVGVLVAEVAIAAGATTVVVLEPGTERRTRSGNLTAAQVLDLDGLPAHARFDAFIECSGAAAAVRSGLERLKPGGRAVLVGMGADEVAVPVILIQVRELVLTGTFRYANAYRDAIELAAAGRVDLDQLVDRHYALDEVADALSATRQDPALMKVIVSP